MGAVYLRSRGGLLVKTLGENKHEIELAMGEIKFSPDDGLGVDWYKRQGYVEITREEFDAEYKKAVKELNKFASI